MNVKIKRLILVTILFLTAILLPLIPSTKHYEKEEPEQNEIEVLVAEVTAYTASEDETDSTPTITASGATVQEGFVACPKRYEFGTQIVIGDQLYECQDRMHWRYTHGNYFDIFMETKQMAYSFGRQTLQVKILD